MKGLSACDTNGVMVQVFVSAGRNPYQLKTPRDCKKLAVALQQLLPNQKICASESGMVGCNYSPLAKVTARPSDGSELAKNSAYRASLEKHHISKAQMQAAYNGQMEEAVSVDENQWFDAEDEDKPAGEAGDGF